MIPKFQHYESNGLGPELLCPSCESNLLNHIKVEVFERSEDADSGVHIVVSDKKAEIDTALNGNPSLRRQGLKVYFWCENCHKESVMSISQHKGNTYVKFECKP